MPIRNTARRAAALLLTIAITLLSPGLARAENTADLSKFRDVLPGQWYYEAIQFVVSNGYFNGVSETSFAPGEPMTRAMFVTALGRMAGVDGKSDHSCDFLDVVPGSYYIPYVAWATENEIVRGMTPRFFDPNSPVTREQIAVFLYRYAQHIGLDVTMGDIATPNTFNSDINLSPWAIQAMGWAVSRGIMQGTGKGLEPKATATRAQVAQMLYNFSKLTD